MFRASNAGVKLAAGSLHDKIVGMNHPPADTLAFEVRDYECDLQGIVNNAVYQNYLEHARHRFLKRRDLDFAALTRQGVHLVVIRAELEYKSPLRSGDKFVVESRLERLSAAKFAFFQKIYQTHTRKLVLQSQFDCAAMDDAGRPVIPKVLDPLLEKAEEP